MTGTALSTELGLEVYWHGFFVPAPKHWDGFDSPAPIKKSVVELEVYWHGFSVPAPIYWDGFVSPATNPRICTVLRSG